MKMEYKEVTGQDYKAGSPPSENSAESNGAAADSTNDEDTVDPWNVATTNAKGVDYDKLIGKMELFISIGSCKKWSDWIFATGVVI